MHQPPPRVEISAPHPTGAPTQPVEIPPRYEEEVWELAAATFQAFPNTSDENRPPPLTRYNTRIPLFRRHRHLPHEPNCRCIQCFMSREHAEMETAARRRAQALDQEFESQSDSSSSISSSPPRTPVLIFDLSEMEPEQGTATNPAVAAAPSVPVVTSSPPLASPAPRPSSAPPLLAISPTQLYCCNCPKDDHQCFKNVRPKYQDDEDSDDSDPWWEKDYSNEEDALSSKDAGSNRSMSPSEDMLLSKIDEEEDDAVSSSESEKLAAQMGMMKSKEGFYVLMHQNVLKTLESRSPDRKIDDRYSTEQLVSILRDAGFKVPDSFGHFSCAGDDISYSPSPPRSGTGTPYVEMPPRLPGSSDNSPPTQPQRLPSSSAVNAPILVPQLYSLKRPGSPDLPAAPVTSRNEATFREIQAKLDGVRGMEQTISPASSPRPHPSRLYGSAIVDPKAFNIAFTKNPALTARITRDLRVQALCNSFSRSMSQDVLHSDRNKSCVSVRNERTNFIAKTSLDQVLLSDTSMKPTLPDMAVASV